MDPQTELSGYRHDRWTEVEGAPALIDAIAQTEDGWLWIASRRTGLYRFDGVRFIRYETRDGSRLQHTSISALQPGPGNALWIGHGWGGLSVLRNGRLKHILKSDATASVYMIAQGADGSTWAATARGLFEIRNDIPRRVDGNRGFDSARSEYVMADSQGRIWASDGVTVYVLEHGQTRFQRLRQAGNDPMIIEAGDGSVWLVVNKNFERLAAPTARMPGTRPALGNTYQSAFDANGNLWTGNCPVNVCVIRPETWQQKQAFDASSNGERLDDSQPLTSKHVLSVFADREGSLWVGTAAGLDRFRDQAVHLVRDLADLGSMQALPHPAGHILVLGAQRLNGIFTLWKLSEGKLTPIPNPLNARVMARAPDGSLLLAGPNGLERQFADRTEPLPLPPVALPPGATLRFRNIVDTGADIWATIVGHGTWRFRGGQWTRFLPTGSANPAFAFDPAGHTYVSYRPNRLSLIDGAQSREIAASHDADIGFIEFIYANEEVFVSGNYGYAVVKDGRLRPVHFSTAEAIGPITGIVKGPDGDVWMNATAGVLRVKAADWARTMRDPGIALPGELFDSLDGYTGGGIANWLTNTAFMTKDGKLWLDGERGLAWLDLATLKPNPVTADVEILGLSSAGRSVPLALPIELGMGAQDVQIDYSSPTLRIPQRVRFRYRMIGVDEAWQEAGTRRTAFYNNLAPGNYRFEVVAVNESGVASRRPTSLRFRIPPRLTQTWWFQALCIAAGIALLFLAYCVRMRHLAARIEEQFNIRLNERESIARALHDTFLQSLQGLLFSMQAAAARLSPETPVRREFDKLLERARTVLVEGRNEVKGLRNEFVSSEEFWQVLMRDVELITAERAGRVHLTGTSALDRLPRRLHHNVYAIVREAVFNALRHTEGGVAVHSFADDKKFVVSITDHGSGLGIFRNGKLGHYGLQGMFERSAQIGAQLQIGDVPDGGAQVVLSIPLALPAAASTTAPADMQI